ncbi:caspase family protein [Antarctobacter sp.]|uniref:caspase family protein n=1 Tax=Antarctobacter sp. TaxID=1872577 RepID=UPI002B26596F|nr:caspase family protein [Antarctobacter sp.]
MAFLLAVLSSGPLHAEERIALVIGNSRYANLLTLPSAARDAGELAEHLRNVGFEVHLLTDADTDAVTRAADAFVQRLGQAGRDATGLFYYAGYGVQHSGTNYLMPADVDLRDLDDIRAASLSVDTVLNRIAAVGNTANIVILDASRAHPFAFLSGAAADDGLTEIQPPSGVFLSYAAEPGRLALRGGRGDSLFSSSLNGQFANPTVPLDQLFEAIRAEVVELSEGQQTPWFSNGLSSAFLFNAPVAPASADLTDDALWLRVQQSKDPQEVVAFIRKHPTSAHITAAGVLLSELLVQDDATPGADITALSTIEPAAKPTVRKTDTLTAGSNQSTSVRTDQKKDSIYFGMSLDELLLQSPLYAPIEGLPTELWQNEVCGTCHNWTKQDLCDQGMRYKDVVIGSGQIHPLGGAFRSNLKDFAAKGCK